MKALQRFADFLDRMLDLITLAIFCVMVLSIVIQVFARYVLNSPTVWSEELARFLMVAITMFGSAAVIRREGHIAVTLFVEWMSPAVAAVVALIRDALIIAMAGGLAYYGVGLARLGRRAVSAGMEMPMVYPYAAIPVGSVLIALMMLLARLAPRNVETDGTGESES